MGKKTTTRRRAAKNTVGGTAVAPMHGSAASDEEALVTPLQRLEKTSEQWEQSGWQPAQQEWLSGMLEVLVLTSQRIDELEQRPIYNREFGIMVKNVKAVEEKVQAQHDLIITAVQSRVDINNALAKNVELARLSTQNMNTAESKWQRRMDDATHLMDKSIAKQNDTLMILATERQKARQALDDAKVLAAEVTASCEGVGHLSSLAHDVDSFRKALQRLAEKLREQKDGFNERLRAMEATNAPAVVDATVEMTRQRGLKAILRGDMEGAGSFLHEAARIRSQSRSLSREPRRGEMPLRCGTVGDRPSIIGVGIMPSGIQPHTHQMIQGCDKHGRKKLIWLPGHAAAPSTKQRSSSMPPLRCTPDAPMLGVDAGVLPKSC